VHEGRLLLDLRAVLEAELSDLRDAIVAASSRTDEPR
jgi:hypothetical protein